MGLREMNKGLQLRRRGPGFNSEDLGAMLEQAYISKVRPPAKTKKYSFSPSTVGYGHGTCARYWYLAFDGEGTFVETTDAIGIANMANGTQAHERLQEMFEITGRLVAKEIEIKFNDPPIRGFVDLLIRWDSESVPGEIKTTRQESFDIRRSTMKPLPYHLIQLLMYMRVMNKLQGFLFYENKNTQEFLIIPVEMNERNEQIIDSVFEWLRIVHAAWLDGELPARPVKRKDAKICQNCPLRNHCWNEVENGELEIPLMEVPKP